MITPKTAKTKAEMQLAMEAEMAMENKDNLFEDMVQIRSAQDRAISFATSKKVVDEFVLGFTVTNPV